MWLFKRKKGLPYQAAIQDSCYQKLPDSLKSRFYQAPEGTTYTHGIVEPDEELGEFLLSDGIESGLLLSLGTALQPTENYSIETDGTSSDDTSSNDTGSDTGGNLGGGDGGGAGAGDSY
jgi:hypothetical protein